MCTPSCSGEYRNEKRAGGVPGKSFTYQGLALPFLGAKPRRGGNYRSNQKGMGRLRILGQVTYFPTHSLEEAESN